MHHIIDAHPLVAFALRARRTGLNARAWWITHTTPTNRSPRSCSRWWCASSTWRVMHVCVALLLLHTWSMFGFACHLFDVTYMMMRASWNREQCVFLSQSRL